jgi:hypothetical protein
MAIQQLSLSSSNDHLILDRSELIIVYQDMMVWEQNRSHCIMFLSEFMFVFSYKAKKKICGFPVSRPYLAFGRQNPDPKLFYWIMLVSVST